MFSNTGMSLGPGVGMMLNSPASRGSLSTFDINRVTRRGNEGTDTFISNDGDTPRSALLGFVGTNGNGEESQVWTQPRSHSQHASSIPHLSPMLMATHTLAETSPLGVELVKSPFEILPPFNLYDTMGVGEGISRMNATRLAQQTPPIGPTRSPATDVGLWEVDASVGSLIGQLNEVNLADAWESNNGTGRSGWSGQVPVEIFQSPSQRPFYSTSMPPPPSSPMPPSTHYSPSISTSSPLPSSAQSPGNPLALPPSQSSLTIGSRPSPVIGPSAFRPVVALSSTATHGCNNGDISSPLMAAQAQSSFSPLQSQISSPLSQSSPQVLSQNQPWFSPLARRVAGPATTNGQFNNNGAMNQNTDNGAHQRDEHHQHHSPLHPSPSPSQSVNQPSSTRRRSNSNNTPRVTIKLRGVPFCATSDDILEFFDGFDVVPGSVHVGYNHEGRPSGEAWVEFPSMQRAQKALQDRNKQHMGSRYIELFLQP
jgi:hypothetical protein